MKRHEAIDYCNQYSLVRQAIARPTMSFRILLPCFKFYIQESNEYRHQDDDTAVSSIDWLY